MLSTTAMSKSPALQAPPGVESRTPLASARKAKNNTKRTDLYVNEDLTKIMRHLGRVTLKLEGLPELCNGRRCRNFSVREIPTVLGLTQKEATEANKLMLLFDIVMKQQPLTEHTATLSLDGVEVRGNAVLFSEGNR